MHSSAIYMFILAFIFPLGSVSAEVPQSPNQVPVVQTEWGWVNGFEAGGTYAFLGVPYARPPLGELRWTAPVDPIPWQGELVTQNYPPKCPQQDSDGQPVGDEDCLYLNLWTPQSAVPGGALPVMVFLHGGGNLNGSTSESSSEYGGGAVLYDGQSLSETKDVVIVTVQYRLGVLGFMAHSAFMDNNTLTRAGNYGLLDQLKALKWVRNNIAHFGGDPDKVLLFGQSAGALDTCMLLVSPAASGLFQRALMQSGGCVAKPLPQRVTEALEISRNVGCETAPDTAACLQNVPATALVNAINNQVIVDGLVLLSVGPTIDGLFIQQEPMSALQSGQYNQVPFAIGSNADEMLPNVPNMDQTTYMAAVHAFLDPIGNGYANQALALYPIGMGGYADGKSAFAAIATDSQFTCPARRIARAVENAQEEPVYRYFFSQALRFPFSGYGAFHGLELAFLFQHLSFPPIYNPSTQEQNLMLQMGGYWTHFAAQGNMLWSGAVVWPEYVTAIDPFLELKYSITPAQGIRTEKCNFWDTLPLYRTHLPLVIRP